ncbi:hypothetical protein ACFU9X_39180, partial [Streptomyces atratus]|uniref:hypothetical protein n=1 Tax=Streptomyces atratus TaxID=1893 RepID=UPI0036B09B73
MQEFVEDGAFVIDPPSGAFQLGCDVRGPVGTARLPVDLSDTSGELCICLSPDSRRARACRTP